MSRGQLPRHPIWFPKMKYRARKRRKFQDEALYWWTNDPWRRLLEILNERNPFAVPEIQFEANKWWEW